MSTFEIIIKAVFLIIVVLFIAVAVWANFFAEKEEQNKDSKGCLTSIVITIVALFILSFIFNKCGGDDHPWEPRHTYIEKPMQNNVKRFIFFS